MQVTWKTEKRVKTN